MERRKIPDGGGAQEVLRLQTASDGTDSGYICSKAEEELDVRIDHENLFKWETARSMIHKKLINYKKNAVRLDKVAHRRYLDLAEVYYMYIRITEKGWGMAEISSEHLEDWGIGMDELEAAASSHITLDQYRLQPLEDILKDMLEGMECPMDTAEACAYVLWSNSDRFAAAAMTEPGLMKQFMERIGSDCYILPSSVYELIVVPYRKEADVDLLHEMVQEVNQDAVIPEDFLSDSVYYCHADSGKVELCCV